MTYKCIIPTLVFTTFCTPAALAVDLFNDGVFILDSDPSVADLLVDGVSAFQSEVCIGSSCVVDEMFGIATTLRLNAGRPNIDFIDTSGPFTPNNDWRLRINDGLVGGLDRFAIEDLDAGTVPFSVTAGAPENSVFVNLGGWVGLGTSLPARNVHITNSSSPGIRFEDNIGSAYTWDLIGNDSAFVLVDVTQSHPTFRIDTGAPESSFEINSSGFVGFGTAFPDGKFHSIAPFLNISYFESEANSPVQIRMRTDSENRRFLAVNSADEVQSQIIFLDDRINFTGETDSGANLWLSIGPNGITSQGPTCSSPCDLTFDPEVFTVPAIEDRAAYMWEHMHLPAIGPTSPDEPINLTEKTGGIIHELEVAHIYIEQLHTEIATLKADKLKQDIRLSRIEALLAEH